MSEPFQLGQLNYVGNHKVEDGEDKYTVLDFTYTWAQKADSSIWNNVNLFMSKELEKAVDWTRSGYYYKFGTGSERFYKFENGKVANEKIMYFSQMGQAALAGNAHHTPLRFFLKNKTMADIDNIDTTFQSRITNSDNTQVMTTQFGKDNDSNLYMGGYGAYTNATAVPKSTKSNGRSKTNPLLRQYASPGVDSTSSFIGSRNFSSYNSDEEKIYIASQWRKDDTRISSNKEINNKTFAYRFAFSKDILDTLKEDKDGYVGYIEPSKTSGSYKAVNPSGSRTGFTREQINIDEETGQAYLLFAPQEFNTKYKNNGKEEQVVTVQNGIDGFVGRISTLLADQQYTVTTMNVDSQKLKEKYDSIDDGSKRNMIGLDVYTTIVADNSEGHEFVRTKTTEKVSAKKGDEVTVKFKASPKAKTETKGSDFIGMRIGNYPVFGDLSIYSRRGTPSRYSYSNFSTNRGPSDTYTFTLPEDVTFDQGSLVELFANYDGNLIENSAEIFINGKKVASFEKGDAKTTYKALTVEGTQSNSSTLLTRTQYRPAIKDIYDTDKEIKGYTIVGDQLVEVYYGDAASNTRKSTETKSSKEETAGASYSYDGKEYPDERGLYEYTATIEEGTKLVKDAPIVARSYNYKDTEEGKGEVDELDIKADLSSDAVIGRVKAKVSFDENYEGGNSNFAVVDAPENEKFATDSGYTPNGLDYNGTNVMPEAPTREGYVFKGWATSPDATEADFTKDTPITESLTVYAVWEEAKEADEYTPAYKEVEGKVGEEATVAAPTFTDREGNPATPENVTYELGEGAPEGAKINADGSVTYTPKEGEEGTKISIPVDVKYNDGSVDNATAVINVAKKDADVYDPKAVETPVETELNKVPNAEDGIANKDELPEGTTYEWSKEPKVDEVGDTTGTVKVTYPDGTSEEVEVPVKVVDNREDKTIADEVDPTIPEKTEVEDKDNLTDDEKKEVKDKIEEANKDKFPEGTEVEVDDKGNATITYPDDSTDTIPAEDLVKEKDKTDDKTDADKITPNIPEEKTGVKDLDNLTDKEKEEVKDKIEEANKDNFPEGTDVSVDDKGNATITYPDGSKDTIPASDLVFQYEHGEPEETDKPELKIADIIDPIIPDKTEVGRPGLTQSEREEIERKIIDANKDNFPEGTKVVVDESGNATIIYPDGSIDTIPWNKLVYHRDDEGAAESDKPADEGSDKDSKGTEEASSTAKSSAGLLPETGEAATTAIFGAAALSVLAGLGLVAKRREDEEA